MFYVIYLEQKIVVTKTQDLILAKRNQNRLNGLGMLANSSLLNKIISKNFFFILFFSGKSFNTSFLAIGFKAF